MTSPGLHWGQSTARWLRRPPDPNGILNFSYEPLTSPSVRAKANVAHLRPSANAADMLQQSFNGPTTKLRENVRVDEL